MQLGKEMGLKNSTAVKYLNRVLEYLQFKNYEPLITKDLVEEVFELAGIGVIIEETEDDEDLFVLLKEIRDSLVGIREDICAIHNNLERHIQSSEEW